MVVARIWYALLSEIEGKTRADCEVERLGLYLSSQHPDTKCNDKKQERYFCGTSNKSHGIWVKRFVRGQTGFLFLLRAVS